LNFFFLTTDIPSHSQPGTVNVSSPHLLVDCWCGGA
jgi:hypothetical protein